MQKENIAVLMGGTSSEREVSLASGAACIEALEKLGYHVVAIDINADIINSLAPLRQEKCICAFNVLHGSCGEDGIVQAILESLRIPYTHSGVTASVLAFHKIHAKIVMKDAGVCVVPHLYVNKRDLKREHMYHLPYVIKPVSQGSSLGVFIVDNETNLNWYDHIMANPQWGDEWMIEPYIDGLELTCGIIGNKALDVIDIVSKDGSFYDYGAKYKKGGSKHIIPAEISPNIYQNVQKMAEIAHCSLGCKGVTRVDFRYNPNSQSDMGIYCLEVNTQPGMTSTSLLPEMAQQKGMSFEDLVQWIVNDASINR